MADDDRIFDGKREQQAREELLAAMEPITTEPITSEFLDRVDGYCEKATATDLTWDAGAEFIASVLRDLPCLSKAYREMMAENEQLRNRVEELEVRLYPE